MKEENIKSELTTYMWHIGRVLTELMSVSDSTNSPIILRIDILKSLRVKLNFIRN